MIKNITYLIMVLLFASCEKYGDVELEEPFKSKLVVTTFIEGGSAKIEVGVARTRAVYANNSSEDRGIVQDADVRIRTPQNEYVLVYDPLTYTYHTTMPEPFTEGNDYTVIVSQNGETVQGKTKLPAGISVVYEIQFDSSEKFGQILYNAAISATVKNEGYHNVILTAVMVFEDSSEVTMTTESYTPESVKRIKNGEMITGDFSGYFDEGNQRPVRIDFKLMVCDDAYTRFNNMSRSGNWDISGGPMTEPVIGYGNMSNGVGVIGSYRYVKAGSVLLK